ncbi:hypothetical protein [Arenibaculum pallidiluteum]|uniref:hypothetical protein n=1 Tax=Arenibaculum pallidiluteum TaxID=2812559 RepID=UPI001A96A663|nr:hypothetical protein [Arenibaculum pallidiluteum]
MTIMIPANAIAEYCWMIGCVGRVGYVFLPSTQFVSDWNTERASISYTDCEAPNRWHVFEEPGLPLVNSTVTLAWDMTPLLGADEIPLSEEQLRQSPLYLDPVTRECRERDVRFEGAYPMQKGAKLRILGYTAVGPDPALSNVYALVQVLTDE